MRRSLSLKKSLKRRNNLEGVIPQKRSGRYSGESRRAVIPKKAVGRHSGESRNPEGVEKNKKLDPDFRRDDDQNLITTQSLQGGRTHRSSSVEDLLR